jgi:hypothetical protein
VKRLLATALAVALACAATPALAQVYGVFNDAKVLPVNGHLGGGYLQFDKSSATLMGQLRLSLYPNFDFGFVGGLSRLDIENDTKSSVRLATDFRGQIATQSANFPMSITLGGALALESADGFSLLSVGPHGGGLPGVGPSESVDGHVWRLAAAVPIRDQRRSQHRHLLAVTPRPPVRAQLEPAHPVRGPTRCER